MVRAVVHAARGLARDYGEVEQLQWSVKGPADFVSAADRRAEQILVQDLHRARPDFSILTEEGGLREGRFPEHRFIIDPLDGTTNYLHAMPHWAISVALEQHGEVTAGCIYDPVRNELFAADKGNGAYMNDQRIRVSRTADLDRALVGCGLPVRDWKGRKSFPGQYERVADKVAGLRRMGAASLDLAYVACGRLDAYWEYGIKPWDYAAGMLLVREAGGKAARLEGDDRPWEEGTVMAANATLGDAFRDLLAVG
ncbi:inositol monophosphatase family protein [Geminicoccus harenae]|uniref:inositol monophosphatase family protein n=1 Tax=Geminicoccus harenae TaxID=2498453 RepID=UPI001CC2E2CB|nr:inositol monophosphatase family protein [Geminicoccus harenae]